MIAEPPDALATATRQRAETTRARARQALRRLDRDGHPITFAAVADAAGVSRSLLYRDPPLRAEIEALRTETPAGPNRPPPRSEAATPPSASDSKRPCTTTAPYEPRSSSSATSSPTPSARDHPQQTTRPHERPRQLTHPGPSTTCR